MPEGPDGKTIIIVKKVSGHGGHHGGAWKVAFADFVTAMMALFMVLWLVNSASVVTREKIASYFRRPGVFEKGSGTPLETGGAGILPDAFSPPVEGNAAISPSEPPYNIADPSGKNTEGFGRGEGLEDGDVGHAVPQDGVKIQIMAKEIKENLQEAIQEDGGVGSDYYGQGLGDYLGEAQPPQPPKPEVAANEQAPTAEQMKSDEAAIKKEVENLSKEATKDNPLGEIDVVIDQRGIHIEIMDTEKTSMFQVGSASIRGDAESALDKIAQLLIKFPNPIDIEGHTDALPFSPSMKDRYDNWNLSMDRANAARRALQKAGLAEDRIAKVVGYAAQKPKQEDPLDPSNRRITITMGYSNEAAEILSGKGKVINPTPIPQTSTAPNANNSTTILKQEKGKIGVEVGTHLPAGPVLERPKEEESSTGKDKIFGGSGTIFDMN